MSREASAEQVTPLQVVRACLAAHREQDWDRLRELFHPEAQIATFAGGGMPGDPERAISDIQGAHRDTYYTAVVEETVELDECAAILEGRVRYRAEDGGFSDVERTWLYVVRDGLLYRSQVFKSPLEARTAYFALGRDLGAPTFRRSH